MALLDLIVHYKKKMKMKKMKKKIKIYLRML